MGSRPQRVGYIAGVPLLRASLGVMLAGWLVACGTGQSARPVDVSKLFAVKSTFGPEYVVKTRGPAGIDPRMEGEQKLPQGVTFDPPDCAKYATGLRLPTGVEGKMASLSADGKENRYIAVAVQASKKIPLDVTVPENCKHVTFTAGKLTGVSDAMDAPQIPGAQTSGTHRQIQATVRNTERTSEFYHYIAYLGDWLVTVTATPVMARDQPAGQVDIDRAHRLLTDSVSAIRD